MDKNPNILQASNTVIGVLTELQQYPGTESTVGQLLKLINTALNLGKDILSSDSYSSLLSQTRAYVDGEIDMVEMFDDARDMENEEPRDVIDDSFDNDVDYDEGDDFE